MIVGSQSYDHEHSKTNNPTELARQDVDVTFNEERRHGFDERPTWLYIKENLIDVLSETLEVKVYACLDKFYGSIPKEITRVWRFNATSQLDHTKLCAGAILKEGKYDWIVKVRPDFVYLSRIPDISKFNPNYIYTRFLRTQGISGLTSEHFSPFAGHTLCSGKCSSKQGPGVGYVNDNMIFVVPSGLAQRIFVDGHQSQTSALRSDQWIHLIKDQSESIWTELLLKCGVKTLPLACAGYPWNSKFNHFASKYKGCETIPVKKECDGQPIEEIHKLLDESHVQFGMP